MSLTLELSSVEERRLRNAAQSRGVRPEELAHQLFSALPTTAFQADTGRAHHEEMTEERRDWEKVTRG